MFKGLKFAGATAGVRLVRERPKCKNDALWAALTAMAVFLVTFARVPSAWQTVWAEDGKVFLAGAVDQGALSYFHFFGGYLHAVPRTGALIASALPLSLAPLVLTTYAVVITSICGATVEILSAAFVQARWIRVGLGLSFGFLPAIRVETVAQMANLQFFLIAASFWALLVIPRTRRGIALSVVLVATTAASTIVGVVLFPVAATRLIDRRSRLPALAFAAVQAMHGLAILIARPGRQEGTATSLHNALAHLVYDVFAAQFFGGPFYSLQHRFLTVPVMCVAAAACFVVLLIDRPHGARPELALAAGTAGLGVLMYLYEALTQGPAARYAVVPAFFTLFALGIVADVASRLTFAKPVAYVAALAVVLSWGFSFPAASYRVTGPRWSAGYARAQEACADRTGFARVAILPAGWTMVLPCSVIH